MYKSIICLTLILGLIPFCSFSQRASSFGRTYSDNLPEQFKLNLDELREEVYSKIPIELKNDEYPRSTYRFADQSAIQLSYLFSSGRIYSDWQGLEDYVNEILRKVIPEELREESQMRAYLVKDGNYNAFITPSGMMFIHIGIFDEIKNEATLAGVLAHELSHYYLKHAIEGYVKAERGDFKPGFLLKNKGAGSKFSIANELEADSLAMEWIANTDYNINGLIESFDITNRLEENLLLRLKNTWELEETTHPSSERRLTKLKKYKEKNKDNGGKDFLVSEEKFNQFKEATKTEILKLLLDNLEYFKCTEKAFKYHIYDPGNAVYVYYLMESIRRNCYLNNKLWTKNFISSSYYEIIEDKKGKRKEEGNRHLFESFPEKILGLDKEELGKIGGKFYWEDAPVFKTYEQAFVYFGKIGEYLKEPECILSNALSLSFDKDLCDKLLRQYLAYDDIIYREYASNLLNGTIKSGLKNKKLTVLNRFLAIVKQGNEEIVIVESYQKEMETLGKILDECVGNFEDRDHVYLSALKEKNLNDYLLLLALEDVSFGTLISRGEKTELHILDPRYWEALRKFNVNEIEFLNFSFYDVRKTDYTVQGYKDVITTDYYSFLNEEKRNRYVDVLITSVREIENGSMKIKYYGGEDKLAYNKSGYGQIIKLLAEKLEGKDKFAKDLDEKIKNGK